MNRIAKTNQPASGRSGGLSSVAMSEGGLLR